MGSPNIYFRSGKPDKLLEYALSPTAFVKGTNSISVALNRTDPRLDATVSLKDLDIHVAYRLHRHFEQEPLEY